MRFVGRGLARGERHLPICPSYYGWILHFYLRLFLQLIALWIWAFVTPPFPSEEQSRLHSLCLVQCFIPISTMLNVMNCWSALLIHPEVDLRLNRGSPTGLWSPALWHMVQRDSLFSSMCESTLNQKNPHGVFLEVFLWMMFVLQVLDHHCTLLFGSIIWTWQSRQWFIVSSRLDLPCSRMTVVWLWFSSCFVRFVYMFDTTCVQSELTERVQTVLSSTSVPLRRGIRYTTRLPRCEAGLGEERLSNCGMTVMIRVYYMQAGPHIGHILSALMAWTEVSSTRKRDISYCVCYTFFHSFREQKLLT